jgi:dTDP-glucose pyrophosphorylase
MIQISNFLQSLGFNIKVQSKGFHGFYNSENGIDINVIYFDSIIGMQAEHKGLTRTLIDSSEINSDEELFYILSRNIFFKNQLQTLYKEMIQLQILSDVKHS